MKKTLYQSNKKISKVDKIDNNYYVKKIHLQPFEAKMLLEKGVNVFEETIEYDGGCKKYYFVYCNIDALASIIV
jgi:hypothetical protein